MTDPKHPDQNPSKAPQDSIEDDWASAMAEQGQGDDVSDDPWADALAEQVASEATPPSPQAATSSAQAESASAQVFKPLDKGQTSGTMRDLEMVMDIPVKLTVELGRTRITIKQLLELAQGSVIELEGLAGEPMDILINGYLIAQGEVVVVDDKYGIRITEIITPSE
ncbi:flagellar motor switch protein FliN, partial [Halomonas sp. BC2]